MKRQFLACTVLLAIFSIQLVVAQQVKQVKTTSRLSMKGAYVMLRQVVHVEGVDSLTESQQFKLFTDKYVMYARKRAQDSLAEYGIGTYKIVNGKVIEKMFHSHSGAVNNSYELAIDKEKDDYTQVIQFPANDQGQAFVLTEDYQAIGKNVKSPLDGAWKQTKMISVTKDGRKTVNENPTQFKMYESGVFMWANTSTDQKTNQPVSFYGYGTFEMDAPNQATETTVSSTFAATLVGQPVKLNLKFSGKDSYEQTIVWPDGSKMIETYKRLK